MQDNFFIDSRSLPERVADKIEEFVINRNLKTGEKLPNEMELASTLNIGRSTVREAIKILVTRNILEIRRGSGTFVRESVGVMDDPLGFRFEHDQKKLGLDLCEIRLMIEPHLAFMAASHATDKDIVQLQELCDDVTRLINLKENYGSQDIKFHTKIAVCTGNRVVPKLIPIINTAIGTYIDLTNSALAGRAAITHQKIVDAIRSRDALAARAAMEEHLQDNYNTLLSINQQAEN